MTSFKILENNNYEIILIENYSCNSKDELHKQERFHIENNTCVNIHIPGRTQSEYVLDNKDKIRQVKILYRSNHTEEIIKYREDNKEKLKIQQKEYRDNHKEERKLSNFINKEKKILSQIKCRALKKLDINKVIS